MFQLKDYLKEKQEKVNGALREQLGSEPDPIVRAMAYSLMAGGKRLRPILCLAGAEAVSGESHTVMNAACALEMIHTYSLIHDDLPAMDNDDLRRGKPTCHVAFDEATAILAGDALLTLAFQILSAIECDTLPKAKQVLLVTNNIAKASGYRGMIQGQMLDMESEGKALKTQELAGLHALKTGALIRASVSTGAILAGGTDREIGQLSIYADKIGLAFQVADDILNVTGDPEVMGKAVGTDEEREKSTYPGLLGLEESRAVAEDLVQSALKALEGFGKNSDPLRGIARYIIDRRK